MKTIAVLGGGGTGCVMAADNALRGNCVRLWESEQHWNENLEAVIVAGGIELSGNAINGFARIGLITGNIEEAVDGADVVLIAAMARRHKEIASHLAPLLKAGQAVLFSAGNCGSIGLRRQLGDACGIVVGEMSGNVYPCRMTGSAKAIIAFPYRAKGVAAFPAADTPILIKRLDGIYECNAVTNVVEATLNSPNIVIHLAGTLLNTCGIDRDPGFRLYSDGLSKHVIRVMEAVESEKIQVMKKMGYDIVRHTPFIKQVAEYGRHPELEIFRTLAGPSSLDHRYINEDAVFGERLLCSLAECLRIPVLCTESLMVLAGVINDVDYMKGGMTLDALGMKDMGKDRINEYLQTGK
jgi:opine dehydrogenase